MRRLVMAVTIVRAGECVPTLIALETNLWGRSVLDSRPRSHRKRWWVRVVENSRSDKRRRGDVLDLMRLLTVIVLLGWQIMLLDLVRHVRLQRRWLWVTRYPGIGIIDTRVMTFRVYIVPRLTKAK